MKRTISLRMDPRYLSKEQCLQKAEELTSGWRLDMKPADIAREIYCHARVYYLCRRLPQGRFVKWVMGHADPIDMADGGDKLPQRIFFFLFWLLPDRHSRTNVTENMV